MVSLATIDEKETGGIIFRVGVIKKLEKENIKHPDIFIPKFFDHVSKRNNEKVTIPVDIVEEGEVVINARHFKTARGSVGNSPPYKGGSLIRTSGAQSTGSLGANAMYKQSYRLLSASHVLAQYDRKFIGSEITVLDGRTFVEIGATITDLVDVALYDSPTEPHPVYSKQDLAWANITPDKGSPEIEKIGTPGNIRKVVANELVKYYGGYSRVEGSNIAITSTNVMRRFKSEFGGVIKYAFFEDLCMIQTPQASGMGPGDSGSGFVAESDNALLGLLLGGNNSGGVTTMYFSKLEL